MAYCLLTVPNHIFFKAQGKLRTIEFYSLIRSSYVPEDVWEGATKETLEMTRDERLEFTKEERLEMIMEEREVQETISM